MKRLRYEMDGSDNLGFDNRSRTNVVQLLLRSDERLFGSTINRAIFTINPGLIEVDRVQLGWFNFFNTMYELFCSLKIVAYYVNCDFNLLPIHISGHCDVPSVFHLSVIMRLVNFS